MHLDHSKLVDLLVENSGHDRDKIEAQIEEMITDMKSAFAEGEGYEVEGFGIFSKLGNNVMFIPSDELETEINYKYAGMEAIDLPDSAVEEEPVESTPVSDKNPIAGIMNSADEEDYVDPFEELLKEGEAEEEEDEDELDEQDTEETTFISGDEEDAADEDEDPFAFDDMEEEEPETELTEETEPEPAEVEEEEEAFSEDIFGEETEEEPDQEEPAAFDLEALNQGEHESIEPAEPESEPEPEPAGPKFTPAPEPEPEPEGPKYTPAPEPEFTQEPDPEEEEAGEETIDFSSFGESESPEEEEVQPQPGPESWGIDAHKEEGQEGAFGGLIGANDEVQDEPEAVAADDDDFDDPFNEFDDREEEEEAEPEAVAAAEPEENDQDFIPVVTNVSMDKADESEDEETEPEDPKETKSSRKKKKKKSPRDRKRSPVMLYLILILLVLGAGGYATAYFGYIDIPGIDPQGSFPWMSDNNTQQAEVNNTDPVTQSQTELPDNTPDVVPPVESETAPGETPPETVNNTPVQEQETQTQVPITQPATDNPETYGLMGDPSQAGNDGYTIVLFSLTRQSGALEASERLRDQGYRAFVSEIPSSQYGVLYRVSVGQFESLISAADIVAANPDFFNRNYFITKIQ